MYPTSHAKASIHFISFLLAYALIVSLLAPFAIKRAQASAATERGSNEIAPTIEGANRQLSLNPSTQVFGKRSGELLGRFGGGVSESDKATATGPQLLNRIPWTAHEGLIERHLIGEPGFKTLEISSGQGMKSVAQQSRLNPAVGSPNPSPFPTPEYGSGGTGPGGSFNTTPPPVTKGAPGPNLPNLDDIRNTEPPPPLARQPIQPNLVCADCDPQGGGGGGGYYPPNDPNFSTSRERPPNETGQPGVDLGSRNFNWSLPLVSLAGRAGLDLNLSIYYNSLVWTKDGSYIKFNADLGSPAPGFRLGLPILQQRFYNSQTGIWAYMMVTSSGGRVELRQVESSNIYEAEDGSYTQLDVTTPAVPVVKTSDGTQLKFRPVTINGEFRCEEIKDRNGNYISATYNTTNGHLLTITDTLGRVVSFVYDLNDNLQAISQTWAGVTHNWALFNYGEVLVAPNFGGGLLVNGPNGINVTVLTRVTLHDNSFYTFEYNEAFGQVKKINRYSPQGGLLNYTSYNVDASTGQTDCPRFTERRDWAELWNGNWGGAPQPSEEAVTTYAVDANGSWSRQTAPDGTIYKEFFATSGWQTGLTTTTKNYANAADEQADTAKKWTTMAWTQDDTNLPYQKNPRPTEANIYDADGNRRRTTIEYTSYSLPNAVREWSGAAGDVLFRRTTTGYRLDTEYVNRRIIGLVDNVQVYDGAGAVVSKVTYGYDWDWFGDMFQDTPAPASQHDRTNYGPSLIYGRGNLSQMGRWDANDSENGSKVVETKWRVNSTGSVLMVRDHLWHQSFISYGDSFSDGNNSRNTFAYPTTVTDSDGNSSSIQYNFDFGAVTRTQDPKGAVQTMTYDTAARTTRITHGVAEAYTRWEYPTNWRDVYSYSTIQNGAGETWALNARDGAGRTWATVAELPNGTGIYRIQWQVYDRLGRMIQQTNPAETNGEWVPVAEDSAGWVWTQQTYDWKGRPLLTTNPDGSTRENIYGGCGCAGGQVTTARDERGRRRRMTMDALGRLMRVEELNWDQSVYATTNYTYNARDQITNINQAGQTRSFGYDGHGRIQSRTTPEQGTTTYSYNQDDTINMVTDARGATATYGYNNRHLVTTITYGVPGGVAATPNVSFGYDAAGNRTSMNDGLGSATYAYNTLSQMTSETRTLDGLGPFTLSYPSYNLGGQLTNITNPWGAQVGYNYDKTGRPTGVTGAGYAGVTSYVNSISYRAFAAKQMSYGNGRTLSLQYDNRMRMTRWDVPGVMGWSYAYNYFGENNGRVTYAQNLYDGTLDRSYDYDQVGRMTVAYSGEDARAGVGIPGSQWGIQDGPYASPNIYDVWGNITARYGWGGANPWFEASYTNNQQIGFTYDAAGNLTIEGGWQYRYDATGQQATSNAQGYSMTQSYDGDRLRVKKTENGLTTYYLRSSVLGGQVVAELNGSGGWNRGYVYLGGQLLAIQYAGVNWVHQDPVAKSKRVTDGAGNVVSTVELDPWGGQTNRSINPGFQPRTFTSYERDGNMTDEAMNRRYHMWFSRFDQPDPYDGSYSLADPQSLNRYAYVQNDPVNFTDPSGLDPQDPPFQTPPVPIDPQTGQPYPGGVPNINGGVVTIGIGSFSGPIMGNSVLGSDDVQFEIVTGGEVNLGGDGPQEPRPQPQPHPSPIPTAQRELEDCVLSALGRFAKAETVTQLKHLAAKAGVLTSVYLGRALGGIAAAELSSRALGWAGLTGIHTTFSAGLRIVSGAFFADQVRRTFIEMYYNRKDLALALQACYSAK